jgi:hypothetical protein
MRHTQRAFQAAVGWACSSGSVMTDLGLNPRFGSIGNCFASPAFKAGAVAGILGAGVNIIGRNGSAADFALNAAEHLVAAVLATRVLAPHLTNRIDPADLWHHKDYFVSTQRALPAPLDPVIQKENQLLLRDATHELTKTPAILLGFGTMVQLLGSPNGISGGAVAAATAAGCLAAHAYRARRVLAQDWPTSEFPPKPAPKAKRPALRLGNLWGGAATLNHRL